MRRTILCLVVVVASGSLLLQGANAARPEFDIETIPCCSYEPYQAIVWTGTDSLLSIAEIAAYCGPILWFSPDEPLVENTPGLATRNPTAFPFEQVPDAPVVYYRVRTVLTRGGGDDAYRVDAAAQGESQINLNHAVGVDLDYFFYYPSEEGFGGHLHDVESTEMKLYIWKRDQCSECPYSIVIAKVNCKAHGVIWYDNALDVDQYTKFPMTVLVEEGKHAGCTDKNGDGYYTPGYDVNVRVNDAWGVRDVIRGGGLFSGSFESWFAKVRTPEYRVFPPLPADSPLRPRFLEDGDYAPRNAKYELRPFPHPDRAAHDPVLLPFLADKGNPDWPEIDSVNEVKHVVNWLSGESFVKSLSVSLRMDGDVGVSFVFPLFGFWHFQDPVAGGWIVSRIYLKDERLRDFGYNALYTTSASRWLDGYVSVGFERDRGDDGNSDYFWVAETGIKFRANIKHSPLSFMSKLTDFWGIRAGLQYGGLLPVDRLRYVIEVGAGAF